MTFMSWRKDYEIGVSQIDAEHRCLVDLINEFHDSCTRGDSLKEIPQLLNRLVAYAEAHFQHEEKLMRENEYPLLDKHSKQHSDLVSSIFAINERFAAKPAEASAEILHFIKNWLLKHILKEDMAIADFLRLKAYQASKAQQAAAEEKLKEKAPPAPATEPETADAE